MDQVRGTIFYWAIIKLFHTIRKACYTWNANQKNTDKRKAYQSEGKYLYIQVHTEIKRETQIHMHTLHI